MRKMLIICPDHWPGPIITLPITESLDWAKQDIHFTSLKEIVIVTFFTFS